MRLLAVIGPSMKLQVGPSAFRSRRRSKTCRSSQKREHVVLEAGVVGHGRKWREHDESV